MIKKWFYWSNMISMIYEYVRICDLCQRIKSNHHALYEELASISISDHSWTFIAMNFIIDLSESVFVESVSYNSILIIIDRFSKMTHFTSCNKNLTIIQFAWVFLRDVLRLHEVLKMIVSDRNHLFISKFWSTLIKRLDTNHRLFTFFHSQTDELTKRLNQVLKTYLRVFTNYLQDNWVDLLLLAEHAYNASSNFITKRSFFFVNQERENHSYQLMNQHSKDKSINANEMTKKLQTLYEAMKKELTQAQNKQIYWYNQKRKSHILEMRTKVWLRMINLKTQRLFKKLDYKKTELFEIIKAVEQLSYKLKLLVAMRIHSVFHISLLESLRSNALSSRIKESSLSIETIIDEDIDDREWEIKKILNSRRRRRELEYLVFWKDYESKDNQWVSFNDAKEAAKAIKNFHRFNLMKSSWSRLERSLYLISWSKR